MIAAMRCLMAVLLALVMVPSPAGAKRKKKRKDCIAVTDKKVTNAQASAAVATAAAFEAALKKQGLERAAIKRHQLTKHEGLYDDSGSRRARHTVGEAFVGEVAGVKGTYIAGPTYWTGGPHVPPEVELVTDGKGSVYRLERDISKTTTTSFKVCECQPYDCGSGCPACHDTVEIVYGPLPDGTKFKGPIKVSYEAQAVAIEYSGACIVNCPP